MAERNVIWTRTADIQFVGILEYWVNRNKSNTFSIKLLKLVTKRTKQIAINPELYKRTDFKDVRVASLGNYSIYYKTTEKEIIVMSFWDNRQDPKKLLKVLKQKR
ncbi:type II toxin-antitoxin system RelE/ParE family toxin [Lacinutrix iliipiscaria]|uniref:Type II toxin-antitoxin system RelE/ParE family toxin n=1 Tax=Lacinutrix iliipiscaria TaxID=1230532 RepID=A0ABW5WP62_9FLAO